MTSNSEYRFYIVGTGNDYIKFMWKDAIENDNVFYLENPISAKFPLRDLYNSIEQKLYSYKLNLYLNIPGKSYWRKYYTINDVEFDSRYKNVIVFSDVIRLLTDKKFWSKLKDKHNLSYCLILLNSCEHDFNADFQVVSRIIESLKMDSIFTFDQKDAEKYGLRYFPSLYSNTDVLSKKIKYDFYFVGKKKNRYKDIIDTYYALKNRGFKCLFRITDVDDTDIINEDGLIFNEYIPYEKVIEEISESYGIVDIKIHEQEGLSLRYFEAVQYNKILLTNNQSVKGMSYYDRRYIYCFDSVDEISRMQIKEFENIDYKYDGRYSPNRLLEMIQESMEN